MDPIGVHTNVWLTTVDAREIHLAVDEINQNPKEKIKT